MDAQGMVEQAPSGRGVLPAGCGCGGGNESSGNGYVLGTLGFDFGTYAKRDAFFAAYGMAPATNTDLSNILLNARVDAPEILWTLQIQNTPVYAIRPEGPFARATYDLLRSFLLDPTLALVAVAGKITGTETLINGQVIPRICPDPRFVRAITTRGLVTPKNEITGSVSFAPLSAHLTAEGPLDWARWGANQATDVSRKKTEALPGVTIGDQLSLATPGFSPTLGPDFTTSFRWIDGTPEASSTAAAGQPNGLIVLPGGGSFEITAPADLTPRVLRLYVRTRQGASQLQTSLSGGFNGYAHSALWSMAAPGASFVDGVYTIGYRADGPGQTFQATWSNAGALFTGLAAVTLSPGLLPVSSPLERYVDRYLFELRNLGTAPSERAHNHAAMVAANEPQPRLAGQTILTAMFAKGMVLSDVVTTRKEACRPGSDCWQVDLRFFHPDVASEMARETFRLTVDVGQARPRLVKPLERRFER